MSCLDAVLLITGNIPTDGKNEKSLIVDLTKNSARCVSNDNKWKIGDRFSMSDH